MFMKTIEVNTTQNVTISYELAEARDRALAFIIDSIIKSVGLLILWWLFFMVTEQGSDYYEYFSYAVILPVFTFYTLFFEVRLNGQTPGKKILKIKVIKLDGKEPVFYDYFIRWTFRILDVFLSFGIVGILLIVSSEHAQRLGDITSNTTVVRVNSRVSIGLKDILRIDSRLNYQPRYPGIQHFREEDILLIKQTIERQQKYRNAAHNSAVQKLCNIICVKLEIPIIESEQIAFLKTVIKDYIVLTR